MTSFPILEIKSSDLARSLGALTLVLLCVVATPSMSAGVGILSKAGQGSSKIFQGSRALVTLGPEVLLASKSENISNLLRLAVNDGRINNIEAFSLQYRYGQIAQGDKFLWQCLRVISCQVQHHIQVAQASPLHRGILEYHPNLTLTQANHYVGQIGEKVMHRMFESGGWERLQSQLGRQGIDGLFVKRRRGQIVDILVIESKFNTSSLQPTLHGMQMSVNWVQQNIRRLVISDPHNKDLLRVRDLVNAQRYRGVLWRISYRHFDKPTVQLKKVISRGQDVQLADWSEEIEALSPRIKSIISTELDGSRWLNDVLEEELLVTAKTLH